MDENTQRREELYIASFMKFLNTIPSPARRNWSSLAGRFKEATGLEITSGLGTLFKGFVCGMEAAELTLRQINEYAREHAVITPEELTGE